MGNSLLDSPAICPTSSPSNKPARSACSDGLTIKGLPLTQRSGGSNHLVETLISSVPDFGSDIEVDRGPMTPKYK